MFRLTRALFVATLTLFTFSCGRADLPLPNPQALADRAVAESPALEQKVDAKLFDLWEEETKSGDPALVEALNERTLNALENYPVAPGAAPFSPAQAQEAYSALDNNLVTSNQTSYEQPGTSIGYCFGRAMFVHLWALKHHYRKGQIRKLWAVGTMKTFSTNWAFHVATVVQDAATGEWRVIDSFLSAPIAPRAWFKVFQAQNKANQDLRLYVTSAEKFTPNLGKYNRVQLGLDLAANEDWYRHYFVDMMQTLKIRRALKFWQFP